MAGIKPKHNHSDRDKIYTPEDVVKKLIKKIPYKEGDFMGVFNDYFVYNNFIQIFRIKKGKQNTEKMNQKIGNFTSQQKLERWSA